MTRFEEAVRIIQGAVSKQEVKEFMLAKHPHFRKLITALYHTRILGEQDPRGAT